MRGEETRERNPRGALSRDQMRGEEARERIPRGDFSRDQMRSEEARERNPRGVEYHDKKNGINLLAPASVCALSVSLIQMRGERPL